MQPRSVDCVTFGSVVLTRRRSSFFVPKILVEFELDHIKGGGVINTGGIGKWAVLNQYFAISQKRYKVEDRGTHL